MSVIVSLLESLGLIARAIKREAKEPNPFLEPEQVAQVEVRRVRLADLQDEARKNGFDGEVEEAARKIGLRYGLGDIYRIGKLPTPSHGVTIDSVAQLVAEMRDDGADDETIADAVRVELAGAKMELDHLVDDAVARDRLIDLFDEAATIRVARRQKEIDAENERLRAELERIHAQIDEAERVRVRLEEELVTWRGRKTRIEQGWADALALMVGKKVVSVTGDDDD